MHLPFMYFLLGAAFTYFAYISMTDTVWNVTTILLLSLASLDFLIGFRLLNQYRSRNKKD